MHRLNSLHRPEALRFNRGIERETLRVTASGSLATSPHPACLGSKLTHPFVTTDFSEAQPELITAVHNSAEAVINQLRSIHRYIYSEQQDELLWSASMPCIPPQEGNDAAFSLAYFGESNLGKLKTTYRNGLGWRYGRAMQTICAVHYNFSFPDEFWLWLKAEEASSESLPAFRTRRYFDLMRNLRRYSWLLIYLFGASPALGNSFLQGKDYQLQPLDETTSYLPFATSLRSSNLGYQSDLQTDQLNICFNDLDSYVESLAQAICAEHADYRRVGTLVDGEYRQVNTCILQSEAEFYSTVRAKRVVQKGQNFLHCLATEGVEYIEVRLLDVNPYLPLGIDESEIRFLDSFLTWCLFTDSPLHDELLCKEAQTNLTATAREGRNPELNLYVAGEARSLVAWGDAVLAGIKPIADRLDELLGPEVDGSFMKSLDEQCQKLHRPELTPSGLMLNDLLSGPETAKLSFIEFAMQQTRAHREAFLAAPLAAPEADYYRQVAVESQRAQALHDALAAPPFDDYLVALQDSYQQLLR